MYNIYILYPTSIHIYNHIYKIYVYMYHLRAISAIYPDPAMYMYVFYYVYYYYRAICHIYIPLYLHPPRSTKREALE